MHLEAVMKRHTRRMTMLELVQMVQRHHRRDTEVIAMIKRLVNSRRVVLSGTFAGERL